MVCQKENEVENQTSFKKRGVKHKTEIKSRLSRKRAHF